MDTMDVNWYGSCIRGIKHFKWKITVSFGSGNSNASWLHHPIVDCFPITTQHRGFRYLYKGSRTRPPVCGCQTRSLFQRSDVFSFSFFLCAPKDVNITGWPRILLRIVSHTSVLESLRKLKWEPHCSVCKCSLDQCESAPHLHLKAHEWFMCVVSFSPLAWSLD